MPREETEKTKESRRKKRERELKRLSTNFGSDYWSPTSSRRSRRNRISYEEEGDDSENKNAGEIIIKKSKTEKIEKPKKDKDEKKMEFKNSGEKDVKLMDVKVYIEAIEISSEEENFKLDDDFETNPKRKKTIPKGRIQDSPKRENNTKKMKIRKEKEENILDISGEIIGEENEKDEEESKDVCRDPSCLPSIMEEESEIISPKKEKISPTVERRDKLEPEEEDDHISDSVSEECSDSGYQEVSAKNITTVVKDDEKEPTNEEEPRIDENPIGDNNEEQTNGDETQVESEQTVRTTRGGRFQYPKIHKESLPKKPQKERKSYETEKQDEPIATSVSKLFTPKRRVGLSRKKNPPSLHKTL